MKGLVLSGSNNTFNVLCEDGLRRFCSIKGKRIKDKDSEYNALAAGDEVTVEALGQQGDPGDPERGLVTSMQKRRNAFGRYNEKGRSHQCLAANIDLVVCVSSPAFPPFRPRFVDRVAILAEIAHVPLLIALNKADLPADEETEERLELYHGLGYGILRCSAMSGKGVEDLKGTLRGKTSVFVGQSGVGKSSLLNAIAPGLGRKTGEISEKYARGRHTTTMAELFVLDDDTRIIDTPGVRRLALRDIDPASLDAYYPELAPLAPACEFGLSCTHTDEAGCRILKAVEAGEVHPDRYESYLRVRFELEANEAYSAKEGWSVPPPRLSGGRRGDGARRTARFHGRSEDEDD